MDRRWGSALALFLALALPGAAVADRWVRDEAGRCEREWTPSSLARGPAAVANGLALPFRSLAGSFGHGVPAALLSPLSLAAGTAEGIVWIFQGFAEAITGGSLGLVPHGATRLRLRPLQQLPPRARDLDDYREDRCQGVGASVPGLQGGKHTFRTSGSPLISPSAQPQNLHRPPDDPANLRRALPSRR